MNKRKSLMLGLLLAMLFLTWGMTPPAAHAVLDVGANGYYVPDYFFTANWANSPPLAKFVDTLAPLGCTATNNLGQCIPIAVPDTTTYPGSDYYEIELVEYREQMHSGLPALGAGTKLTATTGGTKLRGYRQTNGPLASAQQPYYLGPLIIATKYDSNYEPDAPLQGVTGIPGTGGLNGRPVRIKFTNSLPSGAGGDLFIPVDTTIMGSGDYTINYNPATKVPAVPSSGTFAQNRATLHLHGGRTPWISDGTAHQWITPAGESQFYGKGVSVAYVPDMWYTAGGATIPGCAGQTTCGTTGATNNPGPGSQTFYYTNQQSARMMFYHDHAWGITRLNVYVGEAAGYLIQDAMEQALVNGGTINGRTFDAETIPSTQIPLIIQDKSFVNASLGDPATYTMATDPTWAWGSVPADRVTTHITPTPTTGDLWWPHVYMPAQNPYNPDFSGSSAFGRYHYGPWFFPSTPVCGSVPGAVKPYCIDYGPVANPYAVFGHTEYDPLQPPEMPGTPNPSWGAEAFLDTMMVNGTVYPKLSVPAGLVRFRILNASHDRFLNLQIYRAANKNNPTTPGAGTPVFTGIEADLTEVAMVPAAPGTAGFPETWPTDGREGGVPDPTTRGPAFIQIGSEGGLLPAPVVLPNQPVVWNTDPTLFNVGNVLQQNQGGGTLFLGPAERADVIVDFTKFSGTTLILYNDAPTAFPALVPQYDYYTGAPDRTENGGYIAIPPGVGPNIRTVMQITVDAGGLATAPPDDYSTAKLAALETAFASGATPGAFESGQDPIVVGQTAYNSAYNTTFPATWPNWGVSRISDGAISFAEVDGTIVKNFLMKPKAIHDEMGATFDDYGRMAAKLGLEAPFVNAAIANFILQNFVDPATEIVRPGEPQIWRITHNGVDAHPIHFHLFDVQVLNRVAWDGFIRLPDANELGWKDTVRIAPLEDTIVAFRPVKPVVPFALPNSWRPLNPATIIGSTEAFSQIDTTDGGPLVPAQQNAMTDFGHEYTWHCHILSHEENDMMRPIIFRVPTAAPNAPTALTATVSGNTVLLSWTPGAVVSPNEPTGYRIVRNGATMGTVYTHTTSYINNTLISSGAAYSYTVIAFNDFGDSAASPSAAVTMGTWVSATSVTITTSQPYAIFGTAVTIGASGTGSTVPYQYQFLLNGVVVQDYSTVPTWNLPATTPLGSYVITVNVRTSTVSTTGEATATLSYPVVLPANAPHRLMWTNTSGNASLWTLDASDSLTSSKTYGPFPGWILQNYYLNSDDTGNVLWVNTSGQVSLWTLDSSDNWTNGRDYGPFPGWTVKNYYRNLDGTRKLLWFNTTSEMASLWTLDSSDNWTNGRDYGPFPGWTVKNYQRNIDGTGRLIWVHTSGQISLWTLDSSDSWTSGRDYGPFPEWTLQDYYLNSDGTGSVLWVHTSGQISLWTLDSSNNWVSARDYGPFPEWAVKNYYRNLYGTRKLLWSNTTSGVASLWTLDSTDNWTGSMDYTPPSGLNVIKYN